MLNKNDPELIKLLQKIYASSEANNICIGIVLGALKKLPEFKAHGFIKSLNHAKRMKKNNQTLSVEVLQHFDAYIDAFCHALTDQPETPQKSDVIPFSRNPAKPTDEPTDR